MLHENSGMGNLRTHTCGERGDRGERERNRCSHVYEIIEPVLASL